MIRLFKYFIVFFTLVLIFPVLAGLVPNKFIGAVIFMAPIPLTIWYVIRDLKKPKRGTYKDTIDMKGVTLERLPPEPSVPDHEFLNEFDSIDRNIELMAQYNSWNLSKYQVINKIKHLKLRGVYAEYFQEKNE